MHKCKERSYTFICVIGHVIRAELLTLRHPSCKAQTHTENSWSNEFFFDVDSKISLTIPVVSFPLFLMMTSSVSACWMELHYILIRNDSALNIWMMNGEKFSWQPKYLVFPPWHWPSALENVPVDVNPFAHNLFILMRKFLQEVNTPLFRWTQSSTFLIDARCCC